MMNHGGMKGTIGGRDDLVKQILNRCKIYLIIKNYANAEKLIPTLLEDNHEDSQEIIDTYCVKR